MDLDEGLHSLLTSFFLMRLEPLKFKVIIRIRGTLTAPRNELRDPNRIILCCESWAVLSRETATAFQTWYSLFRPVLKVRYFEVLCNINENDITSI